MKRKELYKEIKAQLRTWAKGIRTLKDSRKIDKRDGRELWAIETDIIRLKYNFRHHHISYCELRGRTRDEIELPTRKGTASQSYIDSIKKEWEAKLEEDVCVGA